jgi:hypothetical protein
MRFMGAEGSNDPDATEIEDVFKFHPVSGSWFSYFTQPLGGTRHYHPTRSFVRAQDLFDKLLDYDLAEVVPTTGNGRYLHKGDLVFYADANGQHLHHAQVVERVTSTSVWVVQHSGPHYYTLARAKARENAEQGVGNWRWIFLRPLHTKANL